jgi:hypothetical protein
MGKSVIFFFPPFGFIGSTDLIVRPLIPSGESASTFASRPRTQLLAYCGNLPNVALQHNGANVRTSTGPSPLVTSLSSKLLPFDPRLCPPRRHPGGKMEGE